MCLRKRSASTDRLPHSGVHRATVQQRRHRMSHTRTWLMSALIIAISVSTKRKPQITATPRIRPSPTNGNDPTNTEEMITNRCDPTGPDVACRRHWPGVGAIRRHPGHSLWMGFSAPAGFDVIVCESRDRISRRTPQLLQRENLAAAHAVTILCSASPGPNNSLNRR
jgi:hypothetical protein